MFHTRLSKLALTRPKETSFCTPAEITMDFGTGILIVIANIKEAILIALLAFSKASNMNQQDLADKLQLHVIHLSKMENGHLLPSIDIVQRLMKVFTVNADNLLNDNKNSGVELLNHELNEQLMLISELDEDEKMHC